MPEGQIQTDEKPVASFVLSLLAGLWMLTAGGMMGGFVGGGMMGGWPGMHAWMWGHGVRSFGAWHPWFALLAGAIVLVGAIMLYISPEKRRSWGVVILLTSALELSFGMMGLLGGVLGVIGGALALGTKN
jgi:hypothetical protein